jgi:Ca2+-binding RTX toxin-like protein
MERRVSEASTGVGPDDCKGFPRMAIFTGTVLDEAITPVFVSPSVIRAPLTFPSNVADSVWGFGGDDLITTLGGADLIRGGSGDDSIFGGDGNDTIHGDDGLDTIEAGAGADSVFGGVGRDQIYGEAGADVLYGGGDSDDLYGGLGTDLLVGGEGNDRVNGGAGADVLRGGVGNDMYHVDDAGDSVFELAGQGSDLVFSTIDHTLGAHFEHLELLGIGAVIGTGNGLDNTIQGSVADNFIDGRGGDDSLLGHAGDDVVLGGKGADELFGGSGEDEVRGQDGADTLWGETGADLLIGGRGADVFVFSSHLDSQPGAPNRDGIQAGDGAAAFQGAGAATGDRIDLSAVDADLTLFDQQTLLWGGTGPTALRFKGFVWIEDVGPDSFVRANLDNDAAPEMEIRIVDGVVDASAYSSADFLVL